MMREIFDRLETELSSALSNPAKYEVVDGLVDSLRLFIDRNENGNTANLYQEVAHRCYALIEKSPVDYYNLFVFTIETYLKAINHVRHISGPDHGEATSKIYHQLHEELAIIYGRLFSGFVFMYFSIPEKLCNDAIELALDYFKGSKPQLIADVNYVLVHMLPRGRDRSDRGKKCLKDAFLGYTRLLLRNSEKNPANLCYRLVMLSNMNTSIYLIIKELTVKESELVLLELMKHPAIDNVKDREKNIVSDFLLHLACHTLNKDVSSLYSGVRDLLETGYYVSGLDGPLERRVARVCLPEIATYYKTTIELVLRIFTRMIESESYSWAKYRTDTYTLEIKTCIRLLAATLEQMPDDKAKLIKLQADNDALTARVASLEEKVALLSQRLSPSFSRHRLLSNTPSDDGVRGQKPT